MKVLLVNPNRYSSPPVPPIGLEYVASCLEKQGHRSLILDLCFSGDVYKDIDNTVHSFAPDIAGVTIRNVDSVLYHTNEFFLDEIKDIIHHIRSTHGLKVIIGGTGVSTNPDGVLEYVNADYAVAGPAEQTVNELLNEFELSGDIKRIYHGKLNTDSACTGRLFTADYGKYYEAGGIAGFETHKGCSSSCVYCIEANKKVSFRAPRTVIAEIKGLVDTGCNHFHLCDSEFNENLEYSIEFCTALKEAGLDMRWAVYMKPVDFSRKLFRLMKDTGVYLITLTVDSCRKCPEYWSNIEKFIFTAKPMGIKIAIDFLTGFPYEKEEEIMEHLNFLRRLQPDSVSVNTYIRLYKTLQITNVILKDGELRKYLLGHKDDAEFVRPVFYNHITTEILERLIDGDPLFRIEGLEKGVNYIRV